MFNLYCVIVYVCIFLSSLDLNIFSIKLRCLEGLCNRLTYSIERVITNSVR